jgi:hypothetical protein
MRLIGKRSVASALRWVLGFINTFVAIAVVVTGLALVVTLVAPDVAAGFLDGLARSEGDSDIRLLLSERAVYLAGFVAVLSTWWILNRLRRMFLAVNQGDAFEPANVGRLRGVGIGLIGVQVAGMILAVATPDGMAADTGYSLNLSEILGILIVFMLAEVFRQGADMRDEQMTTV